MEKVEKSICQFLDNTIISSISANTLRIFYALTTFLQQAQRFCIALQKLREPFSAFQNIVYSQRGSVLLYPHAAF